MSPNIPTVQTKYLDVTCSNVRFFFEWQNLPFPSPGPSTYFFETPRSSRTLAEDERTSGSVPGEDGRGPYRHLG